MTLKQITGVKNQASGHRLEMKVWREFSGLSKVISSGSRGMFDVWGMTKDNLTLIICRTNGYLTPEEKKQYAMFMRQKPDWVKVEFHFYVSPKKKAKATMEKPKDFLDWDFQRRAEKMATV